MPGEGGEKREILFFFPFPLLRKEKSFTIFFIFFGFSAFPRRNRFFLFCHLFLHSGLPTLFFCSLSFSPSVLEGGRYVYSIKGKRKKGMSRRIFFCPSAESFFPSPQEGSGRRGEGRKRKGKQIKKLPPDILSAREKRMRGEK